MDLKAYLIFMGIASVLTSIMSFFLFSRSRRCEVRGKKAVFASFCLLGLGWLFGFAGAKLFYLLMEFPAVIGYGIEYFLSTVNMEELSYYGGVAGVSLAAVVTSKLVHADTRDFLNAFACAGALMAGMARFAERFLDMLGLGRYMENGFFPFTVNNSWGEPCVAVYLFEGVFALIVMAVWLRKEDEEKFLRVLFSLCLGQVFFESLRNQSIAWLFVRCEQLLCYLYVMAILIYRSIRLRNRIRPWWLPILTGFVVAALTVAEEFALDKTNMPHILTYLCMIMGIFAVFFTESRSYRYLRNT